MSIKPNIAVIIGTTRTCRPAGAGTAGMAGALESNDGVYLVPAFVGLGAPHWQPEARGTIVGLTRGADARHLARAALEAMAYATREVLVAMERDAGMEARELAVDGGRRTGAAGR